jgi:hypothetical protein
MNFKRLNRIILILSIVTMVACPGIAQKPQGQTPEGKAPESSPIFVIGKIEYLQSEGGYFIRGDQPFGRKFKIANQNPELLEPLLKSGSKHVNIEGRLTAGTNILFIEKLQGEPYTGK